MKRLLFATKALWFASRASRLEHRAIRLYIAAQACWAQSAMELAAARSVARGPLPTHDGDADPPPAGCAFAGSVLLASIVGLFIAGLWIWISARAGR